MTARSPAQDSKAGNVWRRPEVVFLLRFAVIAGSLSALYAFPYADDAGVHSFTTRYLEAYARAAGAVVRLFDPAVRVSGSEIFGRYSLSIVKDCDAMDVNILLAAAVVSFPASIGRRAIGIIAGLALVMLANLTRICALYFIGTLAPHAFEFAHRELFPLVLVLLAGTFFLMWARSARPTEAISADVAA
jgi:exosortase/archaeosortase family protein